MRNSIPPAWDRDFWACLTYWFAWVVSYREKGVDNRVARACRYRSVLRRTRQEEYPGEERKRDCMYITFLKGCPLARWWRPGIRKPLIWTPLSPKYLYYNLRIAEEWVPFSLKWWSFNLENTDWKIKVSQDSHRFHMHAASITSPLILVFNLEASWPGVLSNTNVSYKTRLSWVF